MEELPRRSAAVFPAASLPEWLLEKNNDLEEARVSLRLPVFRVQHTKNGTRNVLLKGTQTLLIVDNPDKWPLEIPGVLLISAKQYLTDPLLSRIRNCKVFNLCKSYRYQTAGYYVSLLAEARGHKPIPQTSTIQDTKSLSIVRSMSSELDELMQKTLHHLQSDKFTLSIYFGKSLSKHYDRLSKELFNLFPGPFLRAFFQRSDDEWTLQNISLISMDEVPIDHRASVARLAAEYFEKRSFAIARRNKPRYNLAVLFQEDEANSPSDAKAIQKFVKAAAAQSVAADIITKEDYGRIGEYDALFIRSFTSVTNYTYRFARRAEAEGLVVIDDPRSIVRCTNKVFLAELLEKQGIPTPRTLIAHQDNYKQVIRELGLPCILKQPDSSFSRGVVKAETEEEYIKLMEQLLEDSDLIIAQEYLRTDFDWRIGIIDQKPLYACKYYMARGHWQIYNHETNGSGNSGRHKTMPVELAPTKIVRAALKAANLMGDGLYGVDLKEIPGRGCVVIEVNDNPSIEHTVEDEVLKDTLYDRIIESFVRRLELYRDGVPVK